MTRRPNHGPAGEEFDSPRSSGQTWAKSPDKLRTRRARAKYDRALILEAQRETVYVSYQREFTPSERQTLDRRLDAALRDPHAGVRMALYENEVVGYYWLEMRPGHIGFLLDIHLLPRWRRKGLGKLLLDEAIRHVRRAGLSEVRLAVSDANYPAKGLFLSRGMVQADTELRENGRWYEYRLKF